MSFEPGTRIQELERSRTYEMGQASLWPNYVGGLAYMKLALSSANESHPYLKFCFFPSPFLFMSISQKWNEPVEQGSAPLLRTPAEELGFA
ncbi:MAG: hypothetical protein ABR555_07625 [Pyrinomonadaceae bacterium]